MVRFLPVAVLVILVVFVGGFFLIRNSQTKQTSQTQELKQISGQTVTDTDVFAPVSSDDRLKILEDAVVALAKKVNGVTGPVNSNVTLLSRISSLEDKVTAIQRQTGQTQTGATSSAQTSAGTVRQPPIFIPLGWVASSASMDWSTVSSQSVIIDTNDYPGMTSAQFEARIVNFQGNGTAYARIINTTTGNAISTSEVSASGIDYAWVISSNFSLASGKNTYAVQLKTNTGYNAQIADAHIKINF